MKISEEDGAGEWRGTGREKWVDLKSRKKNKEYTSQGLWWINVDARGCDVFLLTPNCVGLFPPITNSPTHHLLGVPQFNSIDTNYPQGVSDATSLPSLQVPVDSPRFSGTHTSDLATNSGVPLTLHTRFNHLLK